MNNRQIDCFLEVGAQLNFSRAAELLFFNQSVVSYQISSLEKELGFPLFERDTHSVRFTPAGEKLYHDFVSLHDKAERSIREAQALYKQSRNILNVGWVITMDPSIMADMLCLCHTSLPHVQVNLLPYRTRDFIAGILNKDVDIVFLYEDDTQRYPDIDFLPLFKTHDYCWINTSHPLATKSHLELSELVNNVLVFHQGIMRVKVAMRVHDEILRLNPNARIEYVEDYRESGIPMVLANSCFVLAPVVHGTSEGIVSIPFGHFDPIVVGIAWRVGDQTNNTQKCIEIIKDIFKNRAHPFSLI